MVWGKHGSDKETIDYGGGGYGGRALPFSFSKESQGDLSGDPEAVAAAEAVAESLANRNYDFDEGSFPDEEWGKDKYGMLRTASTLSSFSRHRYLPSSDKSLTYSVNTNPSKSPPNTMWNKLTRKSSLARNRSVSSAKRLHDILEAGNERPPPEIFAPLDQEPLEETEQSPHLTSELKAYKKEVKEKLRQFDLDFRRTHGRMPTTAEKEPIRHLYEMYNIFKNEIELREQQGEDIDETPLAPVDDVALDNYGIPNVDSSFSNGNSLKEAVARGMSNTNINPMANDWSSEPLSTPRMVDPSTSMESREEDNARDAGKSAYAPLWWNTSEISDPDPTTPVERREEVISARDVEERPYSPPNRVVAKSHSQRRRPEGSGKYSEKLGRASSRTVERQEKSSKTRDSGSASKVMRSVSSSKRTNLASSRSGRGTDEVAKPTLAQSSRSITPSRSTQSEKNSSNRRNSSSTANRNLSPSSRSEVSRSSRSVASRSSSPTKRTRPRLLSSLKKSQKSSKSIGSTSKSRSLSKRSKSKSSRSTKGKKNPFSLWSSKSKSSSKSKQEVGSPVKSILLVPKYSKKEEPAKETITMGHYFVENEPVKPPSKRRLVPDSYSVEIGVDGANPDLPLNDIAFTTVAPEKTDNLCGACGLLPLPTLIDNEKQACQSTVLNCNGEETSGSSKLLTKDGKKTQKMLPVNERRCSDAMHKRKLNCGASNEPSSEIDTRPTAKKNVFLDRFSEATYDFFDRVDAYLSWDRKPLPKTVTSTDDSDAVSELSFTAAV